MPIHLVAELGETSTVATSVWLTSPQSDFSLHYEVKGKGHRAKATSLAQTLTGEYPTPGDALIALDDARDGIQSRLLGGGELVFAASLFRAE